MRARTMLLEQPERERILDIFSTRFSQLVEESGKTHKEITHDLKVDSKAAYFWCRGDVFPTTPRLIRISQYFGVSIDYLLGVDDIRNRKEG